MAWKVGQRIKNTSTTERGGNYGKYGKVISVDTSRGSSPYYYIQYDDGSRGQGYEIHYTSVNKSLMAKASTIMKKLIDADTRLLVKAGFLDSELNLTDDGVDALNAIEIEKFKPELVSLAKEKLAEEKE